MKENAIQVALTAALPQSNAAADSRPCRPFLFGFRKARVNYIKRTLHLLPGYDNT